jgi:RNA polymerase-binding protein DksA
MNIPAIQSRLERRREEVLGRLERITKDVRHTPGLEADFEEQAVQRENDDVLAHLDDATRSEMLQIDSALARLHESRYGICEVCHKPIAGKRLEALPYAARCLSCQT